MYEARQAAACCAYDLRQWRGSVRVIITFCLAFILCFFLTERAASFAREHDTFLQVLEPFVWTFGDGTNILLASLLLVLLFGDMPFVTAGTPLYLVRTTRRAWLLGQAAYIAVGTILYLLFILGSTCILCAPMAFPGDQWSEAGALMGYSGLGSRIGVPADVTTMEMGRPIEVTAVIFVLMLMYMLVLGMLMLSATLWNGRGAALGTAVAYSLWGLLLEPAFLMQIMGIPESLRYRANVMAGWLSPLNQATYQMHSFGYNELPRIWQSCVIFAGAALILYFISVAGARRYRFDFTGTES